MYHRIEIERFRGFQHLSIPKLAPITLLTGRNNVGKTSVLEAILLHAAGPRAVQFMFTALRPYRSSGATGIDLSRYSTPWETFFYNNETSQPISLSAEVDGRQISVSFTVPHEEASGTLSSHVTTSTTPIASDTPYSYSLGISIHTSHDDSISPEIKNFTQTLSPQPLGPAIGGLGAVQQQMGISLDLKPLTDSGPVALAFFVSPQNRSPQQELAQRFSGLRIHGQQQRFIDAMRAIEPSIEDVEVLASSSTPQLYLTIAGSPPLPMSVLGEGVNAVANYATAIQEAVNGTVLIDEIENGIHYSVLDNLWQQIGRSVQENNAQVIASTHSAECVAAAYRALQEFPGLLRVLRLKSRNESPAAVSVADYDMGALEGAIEQNLEVR